MTEENNATAILPSEDVIILVPTENSTTQKRNGTSVTPLVLSDDLQKVHDNLSASSHLVYNSLSDEDKLEYLTSIQVAVQKEIRVYRRLESLIIELMANMGITYLTIGLLVANTISKNENYNMISYAITYFIQHFNITLDLVWNIGFNKRLFYNLASISVVTGGFSSIAVILIKFEKIEPTSVIITLISPEIVFSNWISKFAIA